MRSSTRFKYRLLPGGESVIHLPGNWTTSVGSAVSRAEVPRGRRPRRAHGEPRVLDRGLRLDPWPVVKLVNDVPVAGQRQPRVVTELARDEDDAASLVEQQRSKAVAQVVWARVRQTSRLRRPIERPRRQD